MQYLLRATLVATAQLPCTAGLLGQSITLPAGLQHLSGNTAATQPFAGTSARYQQIHDAVDLAGANGRRSLLASSIAFRPSGTSSFAARSWNVQVTMAYTTRTAATMSSTFAENLGKAPTAVLPYTLVSSPASKGTGSSPNRPAWQLPFRTPFLLDSSLGNLCWQWQHHSSTTSTAAAMDAIQGSSPWGGVRILPNVGSGCIPTGRTQPAVSDLRIQKGYVDAHLIGAPSNTPAVVWVGLRRRETKLAGFCAPLLVEPMLDLRGRTNAAGWWYAGSLSTLALDRGPYAEMFIQYAFGDPGQANGVGLSNLAVAATPTSGARFVSTIATRSDQLNSRHNDTLGKSWPDFGLVTLFQ